MVWMRDRSGRSGRRRGSQKPGTTTLRDGATPSPAATAGRPPVTADKSTQTTQAIIQSVRRGGLPWWAAVITPCIVAVSVLLSGP